MYAIIRSGGKQYRVAENSVVRLELLEGEVGSQVELSDVALLGGDAQVHIGRPTVEGARVLGKIVAHGRTRRIVVYKYKPKKGYHRRRGHRQNYHDVLIQQVLAPGQEPKQRRRAHAIPAIGATHEPALDALPVDTAPVKTALVETAPVETIQPIPVPQSVPETIPQSVPETIPQSVPETIPQTSPASEPTA